MVPRIGILVLALALMAPGGAQAKNLLDWLLGEPGSGIHVIPDPRPPGTPGNPPPPPTDPTFGTLIGAYVKFVEDLTAMKNWYTALTPAEQETYKAQYQAALTRMEVETEKVAATVLGPLATQNERPLYALFDLIRKNDPIRARHIFLPLLDRVAVQVNMDYINDTQNPIKARRARDIVTLRGWVGR